MGRASLLGSLLLIAIACVTDEQRAVAAFQALVECPEQPRCESRPPGYGLSIDSPVE